MDTVYKMLVAVHGLCGLAALITFWLAALAKKGSPLHRGSGKTYMLAMIGIAVTAIPMAIIIALRGKYGNATFLGYLVVITVSSMWLGWRAIRAKRDQPGFRSGGYVAVAILNLLASAATFAVGLQMSEVLLMGFSSIGVVNGTLMLIRRARPLSITRWWLKEHIGAMIGCGVATHIAFLAIGLDRILRMLALKMPEDFGLIAWFGPLIFAVIAGTWLNMKYLPKQRSGAAVMSRD